MALLMEIKFSTISHSALTLLLSLSVALYVSGCGRSYSAKEAKIFFNKNQAQFELLVNMIRQCKYVEEIYARRKYNNLSITKCNNKSLKYRDLIAKRISELHISVVEVYWSAPEKSGKQKSGHLMGINFPLKRGGFSFYSKKVYAIYYSGVVLANPKGVPLTNKPYHWVLMSFY